MLTLLNMVCFNMGLSVASKIKNTKKNIKALNNEWTISKGKLQKELDFEKLEEIALSMGLSQKTTPQSLIARDNRFSWIKK